MHLYACFTHVQADNRVLHAAFPEVGSTIPAASLTTVDLKDVAISSFPGKLVLNIFPSMDTPTCALSVRQFNRRVSEGLGATVLCISADLPFAMKRFCAAEGLTNVHSLSTFRAATFGELFGVGIVTGKLSGLLTRAVIVVDEAGRVLHSESVADIKNEPNYDAVAAALRS